MTLSTTTTAAADLVERLERCPFCGGMAEVTYVTGMANDFWAWCKNEECGARIERRCANGYGPGMSSQDHSAKERAIAAWNRRASHTGDGGEAGVSVKPLEWRDNKEPFAETPFGHYLIQNYGRSWALYFNNDLNAECESQDAAKAAAAADYEARIRSALANPPPSAGEPGEAEVEAAHATARNKMWELRQHKDMPNLIYREDAIRTLGEFASAIRALRHPARDSGTATHRHKKRGGEYVLIGFGKMQAENWFREGDWDPGDNAYPRISVDMCEVAIYRSLDDGSLWVRPREEFEDGRFEALSVNTEGGSVG